MVATINLDRLTVDENGIVSISGKITDVGTLDTHVAHRVGDGKTDLVAVDPKSRTYAASHRYLDDNPTGTPSDLATITVTAIDDDTGEGSKTAQVTLINLAPVLASIARYSRDRRRRCRRAQGHVTDVGTLDTHTVTIVWGDGKSEVVAVDAATRNFSVRHVYVDDDPSGTSVDIYKITAFTTDDDTGVSAIVEESVQVSNSAPRITALTTNADLILHRPNEAYTVSGTIEDLGVADVLTIRFDWADGHTSTSFQPTPDGARLPELSRQAMSITAPAPSRSGECARRRWCRQHHHACARTAGAERPAGGHHRPSPAAFRSDLLSLQRRRSIWASPRT